MWENIKKDPLLKTIVVILIGIITFGLAFRIMFGAGNSGMGEGEMMGTGSSLGNILETTIALLIKLSVVALFAGIIVWVFRAITRPSGELQSGNDQKNWYAQLKSDPIIRKALTVIGAVIMFVLVISVFRGNISMQSAEGEMSGNYSSGLLGASGLGLQNLLSILLKLQLLVSITGLIYGIAMLVLPGLRERYGCKK